MASILAGILAASAAGTTGAAVGTGVAAGTAAGVGAGTAAGVGAGVGAATTAATATPALAAAATPAAAAPAAAAPAAAAPVAAAPTAAAPATSGGLSSMIAPTAAPGGGATAGGSQGGLSSLLAGQPASGAGESLLGAVPELGGPTTAGSTSYPTLGVTTEVSPSTAAINSMGGPGSGGNLGGSGLMDMVGDYASNWMQGWENMSAEDYVKLGSNMMRSNAASKQPANAPPPSSYRGAPQHSLDLSGINAMLPGLISSNNRGEPSYWNAFRR